MIPVVVCIDIKNAFNSVSWAVILEECMKRGFPVYLVRIIQQYLVDRRANFKAADGEVGVNLTVWCTTGVDNWTDIVEHRL